MSIGGLGLPILEQRDTNVSWSSREASCLLPPDHQTYSAIQTKVRIGLEPRLCGVLLSNGPAERGPAGETSALLARRREAVRPDVPQRIWEQRAALDHIVALQPQAISH